MNTPYVYINGKLSSNKLDKGAFAEAHTVSIHNMPDLKTLPEMPNVTSLLLDNVGLVELPKLPALLLHKRCTITLSRRISAKYGLIFTCENGDKVTATVSGIKAGKDWCRKMIDNAPEGKRSSAAMTDPSHPTRKAELIKVPDGRKYWNYVDCLESWRSF